MPETGQASDPAEWLQGRQQDLSLVRAVLSAGSEPNYGLVPPPDVVGIDIDGADLDRLRDLERERPLPATLTTETPNGEHRYFRWPDGARRPSRLFDFVTRWHDSGYLIGPGSRHASGRDYQLRRGPDGQPPPIAELPAEWVQAAFSFERRNRHTPAPNGDAKVSAGHRHDYLRDKARRYRGDGLTGQALFNAVWSLYEARCEHQPPLTHDDVRRAIGDAETRFAADDPDREQGAARRDWGQPVSLEGGGASEPFPISALPSWMADHVAAVAATSATPPDLAGILTLGILATVCGGRIEVEPLAGWREGTNLFVAAVMEPGERKSSVFANMTAPLQEHERVLAEATLEDRMLATQRLRIAEQRQTRAEKAAASAEEDRAAAEQAAAEAARVAQGIVVPPEPRLFTDDVTSEALGGLLAAQGGRMAVLSADPTLFAIAAGRYSNGAANLEVYLKGHANDPLRIDRRGRSSEVVDRPALTVAVTVQPAVLREAGRNAQFRGRGLLDRFLYAVPPSSIGYRPTRTPPLPRAVADRYLDATLVRARTLDALPDPPLVLRLDPNACELLDRWRDELEGRQRRDSDLAHVRGWASKLGGATVRIAGLLHVGRHLGEGLDRPIGPETMESAVALARYFVPHALVAFDLMGDDAALELARRIERWIGRTQQTTFTRRDVLRDVRPRPRVKDAAAALSLLESFGYIAPEEKERDAGRPSLRYQVNPSFLDGGRKGQ